MSKIPVSWVFTLGVLKKTKGGCYRWNLRFKRKEGTKNKMQIIDTNIFLDKDLSTHTNFIRLTVNGWCLGLDGMMMIKLPEQSAYSKKIELTKHASYGKIIQ